MSYCAEHEIRAVYDENTIRVYQAYSDEIAESALINGTFVSPPFKLGRMTWIKPSFLWMMYRAGWGHKDRNQGRILAIDISRDGFEWALAHSCPSRPGALVARQEWARLMQSCPVRIQWDPERDLHLQPLRYRSIQIGLSREAVHLYVTQWIQRVEDITETAHSMHAHLIAHRLAHAQAMLPKERVYRALGR